MRQIQIGDTKETVVERADFPPERLRAILGKAWKPHPNLWEIENLMEREQQYAHRRDVRRQNLHAR